ncbi:MAG: ethanolamine utilization protein EutN [Deltaproteobacteria bacterium]|nr:ethanolamine utilization protein EutN [Deltaproteobacteria bacterium]
MLMGRVVGKVWSTRKENRITGLKLLIVQPLDHLQRPYGNVIIVGDQIGAGIGEQVVVVQGSSARTAIPELELPVDAVVIGIIDNIELDERQYQTGDKANLKKGLEK